MDLDGPMKGPMKGPLGHPFAFPTAVNMFFCFSAGLVGIQAYWTYCLPVLLFSRDVAHGKWKYHGGCKWDHVSKLQTVSQSRRAGSPKLDLGFLLVSL